MEIEKVIKPKPNKNERILKITFYILFITIVLLLGAWAAKLFLIVVR